MTDKSVSELLAEIVAGLDGVTPQWCAPGDDQRPIWILMLEDRDCGHNFYTNENDAREGWVKLCGPAGNWNGRLFETVSNTLRCDPDTIRAIAEEHARLVERVEFLENNEALWRSNVASKDAEIDRLRKVVERLGSSEAFTVAFTPNPRYTETKELWARTEFARQNLDG